MTSSEVFGALFFKKVPFLANIGRCLNFLDYVLPICHNFAKKASFSNARQVMILGIVIIVFYFM